jgi:hypothetical protein
MDTMSGRRRGREAGGSRKGEEEGERGREGIQEKKR